MARFNADFEDWLNQGRMHSLWLQSGLGACVLARYLETGRLIGIGRYDLYG